MREPVIGGGDVRFPRAGFAELCEDQPLAHGTHEASGFHLRHPLEPRLAVFGEFLSEREEPGRKAEEKGRATDDAECRRPRGDAERTEPRKAGDKAERITAVETEPGREVEIKTRGRNPGHEPGEKAEARKE